MLFAAFSAFDCSIMQFEADIQINSQMRSWGLNQFAAHPVFREFKTKFNFQTHELLFFTAPNYNQCILNRQYILTCYFSLDKSG